MEPNRTLRHVRLTQASTDGEIKIGGASEPFSRKLPELPDSDKGRGAADECPLLPSFDARHALTPINVSSYSRFRISFCHLGGTSLRIGRGINDSSQRGSVINDQAIRNLQMDR